MGWVSFLEDIEKRLEDAVRLYSPPDDGKRGSLSIESLRLTNDNLRAKNDKLFQVILTAKADIASKKQADFCKDECVRLRRDNFKLVRRLKDIEDGFTPIDLVYDKETITPGQHKHADPLPLDLSEAKQRLSNAQKDVEKNKKALKQAEKVRAEAQNEYQALVQSERNSTKFVHDTGHGRR